MPKPLDLEIAKYMADGWQVVSRTDNEAILARAPGFRNYAWRWLWIGPAALVFRPRGQTIRLVVDARGRVKAGPVAAPRRESEPLWLTVLAWGIAILFVLGILSALAVPQQ